MGGFRLDDDQYNLVFEDPKFEGLRVSLTGMTMQELLDFDTMRFSPVKTVEEITRKVIAVSEVIAAHVVEWNLSEKDGSPTPQTAEGLRSHDGRVQNAIVDAYALALRGVSPDLGKGSTSGAPVDSIPMESLPPNL